MSSGFAILRPYSLETEKPSSEEVGQEIKGAAHLGAAGTHRVLRVWLDPGEPAIPAIPPATHHRSTNTATH